MRQVNDKEGRCEQVREIKKTGEGQVRQKNNRWSTGETDNMRKARGRKITG